MIADFRIIFSRSSPADETAVDGCGMKINEFKSLYIRKTYSGPNPDAYSGPNEDLLL